MVAASLPKNSTMFKKDLQDKLYEQVDSDKLIERGGLQIVKDWLKKKLDEVDLYK